MRCLVACTVDKSHTGCTVETWPSLGKEMLFFQGSELNWKITMTLESRHPPLPSFLLFSPSLSFKMIFYCTFFFRTLVVLVVGLNINSLLMLIILLMLHLLGVKLFAATH